MYTTIRYGDHPRHEMDIFPSQPDSPVLLFIHGGGWSSGCKSMYPHIGLHFAQNGFCTVLMNYRLSPTIKHPGHVTDAAEAFAWVKKNIAKYGGDPKNISIMGHSAGAHMGALLCSDGTYLNFRDCRKTDINKFVGLSGVYDINLMMTVSEYSHIFHEQERSHASPVKHFPMCPCLLAIGEYDYHTMPAQAKAFAEAVLRNGQDVHVLIAEDQDHDSIVDLCQGDHLWVQDIVDFLKT